MLSSLPFHLKFCEDCENPQWNSQISSLLLLAATEGFPILEKIFKRYL